MKMSIASVVLMLWLGFPAAALAENQSPLFTPKRNPFDASLHAAFTTLPASDPSSVAASFAPVGEQSALELKAIIDDGPRSLANINGQIVKVGDRMHQYSVDSITGQAVTLSAGDNKITLMLYRTQ